MELTVQNDGVKFINIYSKAKTSLGQALTNMCQFTFEFNELTFDSVEQIWHYYKFLNFMPQVSQTILSMHNAYDIKKYAKQFNDEQVANYVQTKQFRDIIEQAIRIRIEADPQLKINLRNSFLPFKHFYVYGNNVIKDESVKYQWLINIFEVIRTELWFEYLDQLLAQFGSLCYNPNTAPFNAKYVGRGSKFKHLTYGNPFPVSQEIKAVKKTDRYQFDVEVARSVMQFRHHLITQIRLDPKFWYQALTELQGQPLQCYCNNGTVSRNTGGGFCHSLILSSFAKDVNKIYDFLGLKINVSNR